MEVGVQNRKIEQKWGGGVQNRIPVRKWGGEYKKGNLSEN